MSGHPNGVTGKAQQADSIIHGTSNANVQSEGKVKEKKGDVMKRKQEGKMSRVKKEGVNLTDREAITQKVFITREGFAQTDDGSP